MMSNRFFLDTEFSNGDYFQGDIFEVALVSENTCRKFCQYIAIPYSMPKYVKQICYISDEVLPCKGVSFTYMINKLVQLVKSETDTPTFIAHSFFLFDYPLLFANCMKQH